MSIHNISLNLFFSGITLKYQSKGPFFKEKGDNKESYNGNGKKKL